MSGQQSTGEGVVFDTPTCLNGSRQYSEPFRAAGAKDLSTAITKSERAPRDKQERLFHALLGSGFVPLLQPVREPPFGDYGEVLRPQDIRLFNPDLQASFA